MSDTIIKVTLKLSESELKACQAWRDALGGISQAALTRLMTRDFLKRRPLDQAKQLNLEFSDLK